MLSKAESSSASAKLAELRSHDTKQGGLLSCLKTSTSRRMKPSRGSQWSITTSTCALLVTTKQMEHLRCGVRESLPEARCGPTMPPYARMTPRLSGMSLPLEVAVCSVIWSGEDGVDGGCAKSGRCW